ncbi:H-2 class II histocompatibility antigen, A-F beta chain-like [Betta splendens]|uniref:H-2 class II histocompatibility antigen, A-F beta chain-like n=1 Tax=Betta splendens TaxID=158456 RepID=A0A9W2XYK5_BETSP|nr:H-2 class II histocompatibility antigen, A-F beta chain-like [Betta splendens]
MRLYLLAFCVFYNFLSLVFLDELFLQYSACCTFKGADFRDTEYNIVAHLNKTLLMKYSSTTGNWTGYTRFAMETAKFCNSNPVDRAIRAKEKDILCDDNIPVVKQLCNLRSVPIIKLNSMKQLRGSLPDLLVCSAYDFYPKYIKITWLRNGQEVTSGVSMSELLPDENWFYQVHSYLEYQPASAEQITCMVEHPSLSMPVLKVWDNSLCQSDRVKIITGTVLLVLGVVVLSSGFIYYKKKSTGHGSCRQGETMRPAEQLLVLNN